MMKQTGVSNRVVIDWYNFIRDVVAEYFLDHPIAIGGPIQIRKEKIQQREVGGGPLGVWRDREGHHTFVYGSGAGQVGSYATTHYTNVHQAGHPYHI